VILLDDLILRKAKRHVSVLDDLFLVKVYTLKQNMKMGAFSVPHLIRLSNTSFLSYPISNTINYNVSMISNKK
jgi:hypothetical protein